MAPHTQSFYRASCYRCEIPMTDDIEVCKQPGCARPLCARHATRCSSCGDVYCVPHLSAPEGKPECAACVQMAREQAEEMFYLLRSDYNAGRPCACGGTLEDNGDPFLLREEHESYICNSCGTTVTMERRPSPELRLAQSLRYVASNEAQLPAPVYTYAVKEEL